MSDEELPKEHVHEFKQIEGQSSTECDCGAVPDYYDPDHRETEGSEMSEFNMPPGASSNDDYFDVPSVHDECTCENNGDLCEFCQEQEILREQEEL